MLKFKEFIKSITFCDTFWALILSIITFVISYKYIYWNIGYLNGIPDFYSGTSIYRNVNKFSDIIFLFAYVILFFVFVFIVKKCKKFNMSESFAKMFSAMIAVVACSSITVFVNKLLFPLNFLDEKMPLILTVLFAVFYLSDIKFKKIQLIITQLIMLLGYAVLVPPRELSSGTVWEVLLFVIIISVSVFDIFRRKNFDSLKARISPFALAPFAVLLFGGNYNSFIMSPDDHHLGEYISTFWSHDFFGAKYYKDIMLVHGYSDVLPMAAGKYIFGNNTAEAFYIGHTFLRNIEVIVNFLLIYCVFGGRLNFVLSSLFFPMESGFLIPSYMVLIKNKVFNHRYMFICLTVVCGILFSAYRTTLGSAWIAAALPALGMAFYLLFKDKNYSKKLNILLIAVMLGLVGILAGIFSEEVLGFFSKSVFYLKANLIVFGNYVSTKSVWIILAKVFQYILIPVMIVLFIKELLSEDKKRENILLLSFAILYPLLLASYSLGRVDGDTFWRSYFISYQYMLFVIPLYFYINRERYQEFFVWLNRGFIILSAVILIMQTVSAGKMFEKRPKVVPLNSPIAKNLGTMLVSDTKLEELDNIYSVIEKYSKADDDFLDLTNHGMLYFYMNKKMPIPYVSFYNIVSPELLKDFAQQFSPENIRVILISPVIRHDDVYVSLRIPELYRKILLSGKYSVLEKDNHVYLIYDENKNKFTKNELNIIDTILGQANLRKLPEVWALAGEKLTNKLEEQKIDYSADCKQNTCEIKFKTELNGQAFDYIYFDFNTAANAIMNVNDSQTEVSFTTNSGKALIPFDNIPSWLLSDDIKSVTINLTGGTQNLNVRFYKRK